LLANDSWYIYQLSFAYICFDPVSPLCLGGPNGIYWDVSLVYIPTIPPEPLARSCEGIYTLHRTASRCRAVRKSREQA
jgi:hypothetical protein